MPPARRTLCLPLFRPEAHGRERGPVPTALAGKLGRPHQHQTNPIPERGTLPEGRFIMTMGSVQRAEVHKHTSAGTGLRNARRKQTPAEPGGETGSSSYGRGSAPRPRNLRRGRQRSSEGAEDARRGGCCRERPPGTATGSGHQLATWHQECTKEANAGRTVRRNRLVHRERPPGAATGSSHRPADTQLSAQQRQGTRSF